MNRPVPTHAGNPLPENTPVRTSSDIMSAVVGEVEAALKALERERNTDSVRLSRRSKSMPIRATLVSSRLLNPESHLSADTLRALL